MQSGGAPWRDSRGPCSEGPGKIRTPCVIRGVSGKIRMPCVIRGVRTVGLLGKISAPCMIRGASAAKRDPPWQDLRAMHSRKAICGAFRIHGAHILPTPARFGCMAVICCQEGALFPARGHFWDARSEKLATDCRLGTHRGVTELGDAARTKRQPIQQRALTRPRNREIILVPSAKKRR